MPRCTAQPACLSVAALLDPALAAIRMRLATGPHRRRLPVLPLRLRLAVCALAAVVAAVLLPLPGPVSVPVSASASLGLHPITSVSVTITTPLMRQANSAYGVNHPELQLKVAPFANTALASAAFLAGQYDFGVSTASWTVDQQKSRPHIVALPMVSGSGTGTGGTEGKWSGIGGGGTGCAEEGDSAKAKTKAKAKANETWPGRGAHRVSALRSPLCL